MNVLGEITAEGPRANLFAMALDVAEQKHAKTDPLTGLATRHATIDWLQTLLGPSLDIGEPLAVLIFDIDQLDQLNGAYGLHAGDEVLRTVAGIARAAIKAEDLVGRIGGEEFACIVSGVELDEARILAEQLRRKVAEDTARAGCPPVTISLGLALLRHGDTAESLLRRADAALADAKHNGRNRVCCAV